MLADSNILIYATKPEHAALRQWLIDTLPKVSVISKVEILGYHKLHAAEKVALTELLSCLELIYLTPSSYGTADLFVFPAKAGNQRLYLTGFPPTRERQNRINQRFPMKSPSNYASNANSRLATPSLQPPALNGDMHWRPATRRTSPGLTN